MVVYQLLLLELLAHSHCSYIFPD